MTVSSFPLKHGGRTSKNWGRIILQLWLLHAHCVTLTAKCWMNSNHSYRFCFPPFFCFFYIPFFLCAQSIRFGQWIKVSVWSFTVRIAFFHYVKPQHMFHKKKKTRQQQQQKQKHLNEGWSSQLYNFYSWEKKAWKKIRLVRDSNPWPLRHWCSLYQLNCTAEVKGNESRTSRNFFSGFLFPTAKVANITAMIILHLIRLSVVHIIWFSYIQNSI